MTVHTIRLPLVTAWTVLLLSACDLPPDEPFEDTDSEVPQETDCDSETETDSEISADTTCVKAVLCVILNPEETLTCFEGLDEDDRSAALSLSVCAAQECFDVADDLLNFGLCLIQSCGPESTNCIQTSLAGVLL